MRSQYNQTAYYFAAEDMGPGDLLEWARFAGSVRKVRQYSKGEQFIRFVGRLFGARALAAYHERVIIGVALYRTSANQDIKIIRYARPKRYSQRMLSRLGVKC